MDDARPPLRLPNGFEEAFDPLLSRAFTVAHRILGREDAAEAVASEVMTRAYMRWRKLGDPAARDGWIAREATALSISAVRDGKGTPSDEDHGRTEDDIAAPASIALVDALARLPRAQRDAVSLRHLAGLSEDEAADALGALSDSVETQLHRGLTNLRGELSEVDHREPVGADHG